MTRKTITGVLTITPNLEELKKKEEKKIRGNVRQCKRNILSQSCSIKQTESDEEDPFATEDSEDDVACLNCNDLFRNSRSKEAWISCMKCKNWAHCECAGVSPKQKNFICEVCQD
ncbi:PHD finger protein ALFIN-LIKE 7-like [Sitophilus oryzae]|uniref:PHD finger protein ALFIN-LIKE 7-like n=1 Tax=Sitophilus oryzae TaxID=7048 RepID=A0A6J2Y2C5_SITOR|nr:PHD finger protein ALFIN-LIKE 7-like [Sitophilus oryzae]